MPPDRGYLFRLTLTSDHPGLGVLRSRIGALLSDLADDVVADVQIVATELVTNALLHGRPPVLFGLLAAVDGRPLRVEVHDVGPGVPTVRHPGPATPNGRGLLLVDGTSSRWGVTPIGAGKTVWAEF